MEQDRIKLDRIAPDLLDSIRLDPDTISWYEIIISSSLVGGSGAFACAYGRLTPKAIASPRERIVNLTISAILCSEDRPDFQ